MGKVHFIGKKKLQKFLRMAFFSLFIFCIAGFVGISDTLAGSRRYSKAAAPVNIAVSRRDAYYEFTCYKDIPYSSTYPNNYYDAYVYPNERRKKVLGTIIYVHGGGFVSGSKEVVEDNPYFLAWLRSGFQVIAVDYSLAPNYPYPTALKQLSYCVQKILEDRDKLGINPRKLVLMGDSAGANLAGQFLLTQTNESYGKKLGIPSFLTRRGARVCGFISLSGLLDCTRFHQTGLEENDELFLSWGRDYFQDDEFYSGKKAEETRLEDFLTRSFPPTFLSDASIGSFREQALDFEKKCKALGIPVSSYFPEGDLPHDYELHADLAEAEEAFKEQLNFARSAVS